MYAGALAETRRDVAFVTDPDGGPRRIELVVAINARTDPGLADQAQAGTLHQFDPVELAVPFTYHDPEARRFVLVVPSARGHEELLLRIELLRRLAEERAEIPLYVRAAETVVGAEGLRRALAAPLPVSRAVAPDRARAVAAELTAKESQLTAKESQLTAKESQLTAKESQLTAKESQLTAKESQIGAREERLTTRAEEVTRREDDLRDQLEELATTRATLESRAEELAAREVALASREHEHARGRDGESARTGAPRERVSSSERRALSLGVAEPPAAPAAAGADRSSSLGLVSKVPSQSALHARGLRELVAREVHDGAADLSQTEPHLAPVGLAHDEFAAPHDALEDGVESEIEPLDESDEVHDDEAFDSETPTLPPPGGGLDPGPLGRADLVDGEVRVSIRGGGDAVLALSQREVLPVLQTDPVATAPIALLSIDSADVEEPLVRVALDATDLADRAILDALALDFRVRVDVVSPEGRPLGGHALSAQGGEAHAKLVIDVLSAREPGSYEDRARAVESLVREGVRHDIGVDPRCERALFDEQQIATAEGVSLALAAIEAVAERGARQRWQLARGVSAARLEASERRCLFAMLRVGVRPSHRVVATALSLGVAADERALAAKALLAFSRTCEAGAVTAGLDRKAAYDALANLISWAYVTGASPPQPSFDTLWSLYDPEEMEGLEAPDPREVPAEDAWASMGADEAARWCSHPGARGRAALRLARLDPRAHGAALSKALRAMSVDAAAAVLAAMLPAGDELGDLWVELAGSRRAVAAAVGAVAIAKIKLRRGVLPLLHRALGPLSEEARLFGWAAGEFGPGAVRSMTASMVDASGVDRAAWVLSHVIRAGGGREVERIRTSADGPLAAAATQAVGAVDAARSYDQDLRAARGDTDAERAAGALLRALGAGAM